ncbi:Vam7 protein [Candida orthopsilosis Co 90-125]|uniref:Vam7 protein n=1 Tax=Candida orthopsilosis (strain 90-125) TaxID=1136231 RepID=H8X9I5_CANO9|nr:Vam7 protein [Candida orthopsilosis Co 90-125]CCG24651.1 Vam7 protein [Candida orthopsilosis Co 90-125]
MPVTIPTEVEIDGSTYYQIDIKLPLRTYSIKKRYSDFEQLVDTLCHELGINHKDFPYALPGKRINWLNKYNVIEERKRGLTEFLNAMIDDRSLQNEREFINFLQLPKNFKFQDRPQVTNENWHELYRKTKTELFDLSTTYGSNLIKLKEQIRKSIQPSITDLITSSSIEDKTESQRRRDMISQLQSKIDEMLIQPQQSNVKAFSRVLGGGGNVKETEETLPLNNKELLQHQVQIHQTQDQELEQLRKIIARQRQIGETISAEVEEQNAMLDQFNEEVEQTTDKIKQARRRTRKIL